MGRACGGQGEGGARVREGWEGGLTPSHGSKIADTTPQGRMRPPKPPKLRDTPATRPRHGPPPPRHGPDPPATRPRPPPLHTDTRWIFFFDPCFFLKIQELIEWIAWVLHPDTPRIFF